MPTNVCALWEELTGLYFVPPAPARLGSNARPFSALCFQQAWVSRVVVAPAAMCLQGALQRPVVRDLQVPKMLGVSHVPLSGSEERQTVAERGKQPLEVSITAPEVVDAGQRSEITYEVSDAEGEIRGVLG